MIRLDHYRNQIRELYQVLNKIAEDALAYFVDNPDKISARLMKELNACISSVSKTLADNPEIIIEIDRDVEMAKINEELVYFRNLLKTVVIGDLILECSNPDCDAALLANTLPKPAQCPSCGSPFLKTEKDIDNMLAKIREQEARELDVMLALKGGLDPVEGLGEEAMGLRTQLKNSLKICGAKLDELKESDPDQMSAAMLKECLSFLNSASALVDRMEALSVPAPAKPPTPDKKSKDRATKPRKRKTPILPTEPLDFGDMGIIGG